MTDDPRRVILARRARFLTAAVAGMAVSACGGETSGPEPCLSPVYDAGSDADAQPEPCLGMPQPDAEPEPCLSAPAPDAQPEPCLGAPMPDAEPEPCLDMPPPDASSA
jgi:hypothetical protein